MSVAEEAEIKIEFVNQKSPPEKKNMDVLDGKTQKT
jgi:hypothetical protein